MHFNKTTLTSELAEYISHFCTKTTVLALLELLLPYSCLTLVPALTKNNNTKSVTANNTLNDCYGR